MSYTRDPQTATQQTPPDLRESTGAGPITPAGTGPAYNYAPRRVSARSRLERIGFWILVAAALVVLLLLTGVIVPKLMGGVIMGFYIGLFAGILTLLNLRRPSGWGNAVLGRKVFPVLRVPDEEIWRLAGVNAMLMFLFTFIFGVLEGFVGPFLGGILVFVLLIGAAVFYSRIRTVVITKP